MSGNLSISRNSPQRHHRRTNESVPKSILNRPSGIRFDFGNTGTPRPCRLPAPVVRRRPKRCRSDGKRAKVTLSPADPGSIVYGKSSAPAGWRSRNGEEPLQRDRSVGFPIQNVLCLLGVAHNYAGEDAGEAPRVSSNNHGLLLGVGGQSAQRFLSPVFQNEGNCLAQVRQAFFVRFALTIGAWHLGAVCHEPRSVPLDDCSELVAHDQFYPARRARKSQPR